MKEPEAATDISSLILTALGDALDRDLAACGIEVTVPVQLFHLTDVSGLIGITSTNQLWASLATATNDASEVRHGNALSLDVLYSRYYHQPTQFHEFLLAFLYDPSAVPRSVTAEPFVVSFCGRPSRSAQWLHYGCSGRGVAIGFDARIGAVAKYDWTRVDYDLESQRRRIEALLDCLHPVLADVHARFPQDATWTNWRAAVLAQAAITSVTPRMKHPAFADEDEYRLVGQRIRRSAARQGENGLMFRAKGDRLVPFEGVAFSPNLIVEVLLGYSCPTTVEAVQMLLEERGITAATVSRSQVPVR